MKTTFALLKIITLTIGVIALANCAHTKQIPTQISAADYLQLAEQAQGTEKTSYQLKAIDAYLAINQVNSAQQLIKSIPESSLTTQQINQLTLQKIRIALLDNHSSDALAKLNNFTKDQLTTPQAQEYYKLYAKAYLQKGEIINSINMRINLATYLSDSTARKQNLWSIWKTLQALNVSTLAEDAAKTPDSQLQGWLSLALLTKTWESRPNELISQLKQWQNTYPGHPANRLLPTRLKAANITSDQQKIALLIPLSGEYANYGKIIRNGFFTAYYDRKKHRDALTTIRVYDTGQNNISTIYQKAVDDGANIIVGPLQKKKIAELVTNNQLSVPTLSLNTVSDSEPSLYENLFTFGLSPVDEAQQAAQFAIQTHHQKVIVIAKDDTWSKGLVNAFTSQWQQLGGSVTEVKWVNKQKNMSTDIRNVLHIQQAHANKRKLQKILHEKVRYIPRRRQDFDSIFLVVSPEDAKQIVPLLRFYFAHDTPVFSISRVYKPNKSSKYNRDLDGVYFCDTPWILDPDNLLPSHLNRMRKHISTLWPEQSKQYGQFFALGVDAFDLTFKLNKMQMLPELSTLGATGTLTLTRSHHLYRQLPWAVIKKGKPQVVNT